MYFTWLRLLNAAIEIVAATCLIPATIILAHYGGRFRFLFIALLWITLTGFTWVTGIRIGRQLPISDVTIVTTFITGAVAVCAGSILAWYLYMAHNGRLPARTPPEA